MDDLFDSWNILILENDQISCWSGGRGDKLPREPKIGGASTLLHSLSVVSIP